MSRVRGVDTNPERRLRSALHRAGLRFRLHGRDLPGRPDLVLSKHRTVVFIHGCFWHRHGCRKATVPKSNVSFWTEKFAANVRRDAAAETALLEAGWRVLVVWECVLPRNPRTDISAVTDAVVEWLGGDDDVGHIPFAPSQ